MIITVFFVEKMETVKYLSSELKLTLFFNVLGMILFIFIRPYFNAAQSLVYFLIMFMVAICVSVSIISVRLNLACHQEKTKS